MDLMEYKARELFEAAGLPVKKGATAETPEALVAAAQGLTYPLVCKAQVQVGGRGKAGGIKTAKDEKELLQVAGQILGMDIKGHIVRRLMAVEMADIAKELYLSIMLDRLTKCPLIIFSSQGGMEIEEVAKTNPDAIRKEPVDPLVGLTREAAADLAAWAGLTGETADQFCQVLQDLYAFFMAKDCLLAEINPLAVDSSGSIVALDGKVSIDDSALYRQPEAAEFKQSLQTEEHPLVLEAKQWNFLYIPCQADGTIAVASNGSGMLMSCMDRIHDKGMSVCAALDLGGGATSERIKEAVRIISCGEQVKAVFINIFGGITRCDEVAGGVRAAKEQYGIEKPIIIRFEGTNKEKGMQIIQGLENVIFVDGLIQGVDALVSRKDRLL